MTTQHFLCGLWLLAGSAFLSGADSPPPARFVLDKLPAYTPADVAGTAPGRDFAGPWGRGQLKEAVAVAEAAAASGQAVGHFLLGFAADQPPAPAAADPVRAEKHYRDGVKLGDLPSEVNLAALLLRRDAASEEAAILLNAAADKDIKIAGLFLGIASLTGANGKPNPAQAAQLWARAGEAGNVVAWRHLGFLRQGALGILEDLSDAQAAEAFEKAAQLGEGESAVRLGVVILQSGDKIGRPAAEAEGWFKKGAESGQAAALYLLGQVREQGVKSQVADPKLAREAYQAGADLRHAPSMVKLGHLSESAGNLDGALKWYRAAMDLGDGEACHRLAQLTRAGKGGQPKDDGRVFQLFLQAGTRGYAPAAMEIGDCYRFGTGAAVDPFAAATWLTRGVEAGDPDAMVSLAEMMLSSQGIPFNPPILNQLTERAFKAGNARAGLLLARMTERGIGVAENLPKALAYYRWAATRKMTEAEPAAADLQKRLGAEQVQEAAQMLKVMEEQTK